jgi:hypothetical protein
MLRRVDLSAHDVSQVDIYEFHFCLGYGMDRVVAVTRRQIIWKTYKTHDDGLGCLEHMIEPGI